MKENPGIAIKFYRVERWLYLHKMKWISLLWFRMMQLLLGCTIPPSCEIDKGVIIAHFHGIVFNHILHIGSGTVIYQNVTLGGINGRYGPNIGKNCIIGAGAVLLGDIHVGDNVKIGANAVVLKDVPSNCTVVGIPAQIVKRERV